MMNFMVGARVGDEYVPMMLEELALDGNDSRAPRWSRDIPPVCARSSTSLSSAPECPDSRKRCA